MAPATGDHVVAVIVGILLPAYGVLSWKWFQRGLQKGSKNALLKAYAETLVIQWSIFAAIVVLWKSMGRSFGDLGFTVSMSAGFLVSMILTVAGCVFLIHQCIRVQRLKDNLPQSLLDDTKSIEAMAPRTVAERRAFFAVALTAGICEETMYRGFLITFLQAYIGLPLSLLVSTALFGVAHLYQGAAGVVKTVVVGGLLASLYWISGSLLGPILLHAVTDVTGGIILQTVISAKNPPHPALRENL